MKPKLNKNLSLPWTSLGEKVSGNHQNRLPREFAHMSSYSGYQSHAPFNDFFRFQN